MFEIASSVICSRLVGMKVLESQDRFKMKQIYLATSLGLLPAIYGVFCMVGLWEVYGVVAQNSNFGS